MCTAPGASTLSINGQAARREGDKFTGEVVLRGHVTEVVATAGSVTDRVRVVWDRYSKPRYHFAIDDNMFFLRDIARKKYASLFDCFYLKTLRDLHRKYGTRFSVNITIRDAIVCNSTPVDRVAPTLDPLAQEPNRRETVNLLTHEQYFWPFYKRYVPDHAQRCEAAIRWATDHGYQPVFFHEGFLGGPE